MSASADLHDVLSSPVLVAAPRLLGAELHHRGVGVRITEVEAYDGANDPGSHAYRGRTERNATMFGAAGHLYVYFVYGMHHCCNVVTGTVGAASAVLLRAGEVTAGHHLARARRGENVTDRDLARGPARLCVSLAIDRSLDGSDLAESRVRLSLAVDPPAEVARGPRVGLRQAAERPWRFWIAGDPTMSPYRPAARRADA